MAAMRAYAEGLPLDGTLQLFDEPFFPGYGWAFPTGPDGANVGVGVLTDGITGEGVSLRRWFERLVGYLTEHARRCGARLVVGEPVGFPIRSYRPGARYSFARGLLVGEAAGLVDPLNGEGIPLALESASLAGETLRAAFARGSFAADDLAAYDRACVARFDADLRVSDLLISTVANRHLAAVWIRALELFARLADGDPAYAHTAGGVLAGVVPARELFSPEMLTRTALEAPLVVGAMLAGNTPRTLGGLVDHALGWMQRAAAVGESIMRDGEGVADWLREVAGKEQQLARLLLRRFPAG
jgi:flavin-dependent dehydrogenase